VERLRASGVGILYVTHRLGDVSRVADRAAVLRDGSLVGTVTVAETSEQAIVELIVGAKLDYAAPAPRAHQDELLRLDDVAGDGADGVSLTLHRGEILALVGLVGAGHRSVGRMVAGVEAMSHGQMRLRGERYAPRTARDAQRRGVVYVPGDRLGEGAFPTLDSGTNFALRDRRTAALATTRNEASQAAAVLEEWRVVPQSPAAPFAALSGGNQQKVVLAKWMNPRPDVLVAEEPTAGIDVATRVAIYDRLAEAAQAGTAVLLLSSDADEVAAIADRAIVFSRGKPRIELSRVELSPTRIAQECYTG
jgi:ribose transport system ATP-binding protein